MKRDLLNTTALVSAVLAAGAFAGSTGASAQVPDCPSNFTGTGNVSNAICNAVGTPIPFTATIHLDVEDTLVALVGGHSVGNDTNAPAAGNNNHAGNKNFGITQDAWARFKMDAPAGADHYGFNFNLLLNSNQQVTIASKQKYLAGTPTVAINNSASHSPSQIDREWMYFKDPQWGEFQVGEGGSPVTVGFPYGSNNYGPPGAALQGLGVNGGIFSQSLGDATAYQLDSDIGMMGGGGRGTKGAVGVRWISPWMFGTSPGHGFRFDIKFSPDGHGHNEGNIAYDNAGVNANVDLGESVTPATQMDKQFLITEMALSYDDEFGPFEIQGGIGLDHGFAKGGSLVCSPGGKGTGVPTGPDGSCNSFGSAPTFAGGLGGYGQTDASHAANADYQQLQTGAAVTWNDALTIGGEFDYDGHGMYPSNSPAFYCGPTSAAGGCSTTNGTMGKTNSNWGASIGIEYDWDRYQVGAWAQHAQGQGDMNDVGYIQIDYVGVGAGVRILKGLKGYGEIVNFHDQNHHSDLDIAGGGCGDSSCKRKVDGAVLMTGISLDF
jgi:hypothetical protein